MRIISWDQADKSVKASIFKRSELDITEYTKKAASILEEVKKSGDKGLLKYLELFHGYTFSPEELKVKDAEFDEAEKNLPDPLKEAIRKSIRNVRAFHSHQIPGPWSLTEISPGVFAGEKTEPIPSVGIYVPRGKGSFPSMTYMQAVPAVIAGVKQILIASPPDSAGKADPATLFTARECGISDVYKISGVQGMAALAYGTESVPKVEKIIGPGSGYVTAAKRLLYGTVDIGLPAGPSESIVLADSTADPEKAAFDLLIEGEHGADSAALLVTDSKTLAEKVAKRAEELISQLPQPRRGFLEENMKTIGGIILCTDFKAAIDFVNSYAPEHLQILARDPFVYLGKIKNAGEILLGDFLPSSLANFSVGVNAVLPTGGFAKTFSAVSVRDFIKYISIAYVTEEGYEDIAPAAAEIADYEDFPAHKMALELRMKTKRTLFH